MWPPLLAMRVGATLTTLAIVALVALADRQHWHSSSVATSMKMPPAGLSSLTFVFGESRRRRSLTSGALQIEPVR